MLHTILNRKWRIENLNNVYLLYKNSSRYTKVNAARQAIDIQTKRSHKHIALKKCLGMNIIDEIYLAIFKKFLNIP